MFKSIVYFTLILFFGTLIFVTISAYSRKSGSVKLDMGKIEKIRTYAVDP